MYASSNIHISSVSVYVVPYVVLSYHEYSYWAHTEHLVEKSDKLWSTKVVKNENLS